MSEKKKTRGVFAAFVSNMVPHMKPGYQLLSERMDNKGWNLLGGRVEDGESDEVALRRECREEGHIEIQILCMLGEPLIFGDDTAVCYLCKIASGQLQLSPEAKCHRWCSAEEVRQGFWVKTHKEHMDGVSMTCGTTNEPLQIVGPKDKLGRTGRFVWDAFSIMQSPVEEPNPNTIYPGLIVSDDKLHLIDTGSTILKKYRRLDPYGKDGLMQLPS